jgi:hypothetical protein
MKIEAFEPAIESIDRPLFSFRDPNSIGIKIFKGRFELPLMPPVASTRAQFMFAEPLQGIYDEGEIKQALTSFFGDQDGLAYCQQAQIGIHEMRH